jgi:quinol monooxygenase YgiN
MPNSRKWNPVTWRALHAVAVLVLAATWFAGPARSQEAAKNGPIYAVIHVDSVPTDAANVTKLLQQYAVDTRKDKGAVRIEVYVQADRGNHFSIVEVWQDQQAYDAHIAAAHTKKFREQIQPSLGSPFDERLHRLLQ